MQVRASRCTQVESGLSMAGLAQARLEVAPQACAIYRLCMVAELVVPAALVGEATGYHDVPGGARDELGDYGSRA